jgi:hypothetical protein
VAQINLDTLPRSRKEALALGSKLYFTGKPCKHGHVSHRNAKGQCMRCNQLASQAAVKAQAAANAAAREERLRGKTCAECGTPLAGQQQKFCSRRCIRREWAKRNPEKIKESIQARNRRYPGKRSEESRRWLEKNRHVRHAYYKAKYNEDSGFRLRVNLRALVRNSLAAHSASKSGKTMDLTGCSWLELRAHLESQFLPGMSWENRGAWHIDHIIPCASFDLTDPEQQKACFHYTNLQPLWAEDNIKKGARLAA